MSWAAAVEPAAELVYSACSSFARVGNSVGPKLYRAPRVMLTMSAKVNAWPFRVMGAFRARQECVVLGERVATGEGALPGAARLAELEELQECVVGPVRAVEAGGKGHTEAVSVSRGPLYGIEHAVDDERAHVGGEQVGVGVAQITAIGE